MPAPAPGPCRPLRRRQSVTDVLVSKNTPDMSSSESTSVAQTCVDEAAQAWPDQDLAQFWEHGLRHGNLIGTERVQKGTTRDARSTRGGADERGGVEDDYAAGGRSPAFGIVGGEFRFEDLVGQAASLRLDREGIHRLDEMLHVWGLQHAAAQTAGRGWSDRRARWPAAGSTSRVTGMVPGMTAA